MHFRWGLGPVFRYEWKMMSRRWQMYAVRVLVVSVLYAALTAVWVKELAGVETWGSLLPHYYIPSQRAMFAARQQLFAKIGETFTSIMLTALYALVVVLAPTTSAGAVCQDKARGPLFHLLTTDLSSTEIILGKFVACLIPLLGLIGCSLPVLFAATLFGGVELQPLIGSYLILLAIALLGCALSLVISVWARRTTDVLVLSFSFWALVLLSDPIIQTLKWLLTTLHVILPPPPTIGRWVPPEPSYSLLRLVLAPIEGGVPDHLQTALSVLGVSAGLCAGLLFFGILGVRRVTVAQAGQDAGRRRSFLSRLLGKFSKS